MQKVLEKSENPELDEVLDKIDKIWNEISNLREATYTYIDLRDWTFFNETFFSEFLWKENTKESILSQKNNDWFWIELKEKMYNKISSTLDDIKNLTNRINSLNIDNKADILSAVNIYIVALDFTKTAIDFELEKAWLLSLSEEDAEELTKEQNINDEKLFWKKASENPTYLKDNYYFLYKKFFINKNNYTEEEKIEIEWFLKIIENKIIDLWEKIDLNEIKQDEKDLNEYQKEFQELSKIKIKREDYKEMFDLFFELMEVPQRSEVWNFSSFYDWDKVYWIPNNDKYKEKSLSELIDLFFHEATHYINAKVSKDKKLPKLPWDMIKEEWLAMIWSELIMWKKLEDIDYISKSFPDVIMSHLLDWEELKKFLKLNRPELDINSTLNRRNRWYSKNEVWAFNKDVSYPMWMYEVLEYLKSWKPLENLYSWKVWFDKVESWEYLPENFWNKFLYPLIMSEFFIFYLKNKSKNKNDWISNNFNLDFIKRLKDKYSDFEHYFDLFNEAEIFSHSQKKKLFKIINYIKK